MSREETDDERADRMWTDLLQEFRVMQTGVQITAAFLVSLPFQSRFDQLTASQERIYLGLVLLAAVTTALLLAPVALHRRLSGRHAKPQVVVAVHRASRWILACVAALVLGITGFVFEIVAGTAAAWVVVAGIGLAMVVVLVGWPQVVLRRHGSTTRE